MSQYRGQLTRLDSFVRGCVLCHAHRDMPEYGADLPLQAAHAGFSGVVSDDAPQGVVAQFALCGGQAAGFQLARNQKPPGDLKFLGLGVPGKIEYLHAVPQGARDGFGLVGSGKEHDRGQVEWHP